MTTPSLPNQSQQAHSPHDQLCKELFKTFYPELLQLFAPRLAKKLKRDTKFLEQELFTQKPLGDVRRLDILAQSKRQRTTPNDGFVLSHTEIEANYHPHMGTRGYHYQSMIHAAHRRSAFYFVIFLTGGPPGLRKMTEDLQEEDETVVRFYWRRLCPEKMSPEKVLRRSNVLWAALAVFMKATNWSRAQRKAECLLRVAKAKLDPEREFTMVEFIKTYLQLDTNQQVEYNNIISQRSKRKVKQMELTWSQTIRRDAIAEGEAKGEAKALLHILRKRNIATSEEQRQHILACTNLATLEKWLERAFDISHIDELWGSASGTNVPSR